MFFRHFSVNSAKDKFIYIRIAAGDRMFLRKQDFDFCPNLIKLYSIYPNFIQIFLNFIQICRNFAQICLKKFARGCGRIPSSYVTTNTIDFLVLVLKFLQFSAKKLFSLKI